MHHIIYHMDSDGHGGGAVIYRFLRTRRRIEDKDIAWHPFTYGVPLPEEINYGTDSVYVVDVGLPAADVQTLLGGLGFRFVWIDHHDTSVITEKENPEFKTILGIRQVEWDGIGMVSGCELAWKHFYGADPIPEALTLVGDWDTWRWRHTPEERQEDVQAYQYFLRSFKSDPKHVDAREWWLCALDDAGDTGKQIDSGRALLEYQRKQWKGTVGFGGFEADFQGHKVVMVNALGNSEMFKGYFNPEKHEFMVTFQLLRGKFMKVSLYGSNSKVHLGKLARELSKECGMGQGGGHAGAAGFQCSWDFFDTLYTATGDFTGKKK